MKRWVTIGLVLLGVLGVGTVLSARDADPGKPIAHEPIPRADGLRAKPSSDPVFVFEQPGDEPVGRSGAEASMGDQPNSGSAGEGEVLYRPAGTPSDPSTDTVHSVAPEIKPDTATGVEPWLKYHAVFNPAVIPFKRNSAKDQLRRDGALVVGSLELTEISLTGNRSTPGYEQFRGSVMLELSPKSPSPMPSVAPSSRLLVVHASPHVELRFFKDGADNFFVSGGDFSGRVHLTFMMDAPSNWFSHSLDRVGGFSEIPTSLRPVLPSLFEGEVDEVVRRIGVKSRDQYAVILRKLVLWFRGFKAADLPPNGQGSLYRQIALSQRGICRHRVYAFVVTAHGLGIPARYVANEAHVFAEVYLPGSYAGWLRIDLGGGAMGMDIRGGAEKTRHSSVADDPFGFPEGFESGYSHQALMGLAGTADEGDTDVVRGLPPSADSVALPPASRSPAPTRSNGVSKWGSSARPAIAGGAKKSTATTLRHVSAQAFRGEKLSVVGSVMAADKPVSNGVVRIVVLDRTKTRIMRVLGQSNTNAKGVFEANLMIPADLALGTWEIGAEFVGTSELEASSTD